MAKIKNTGHQPRGFNTADGGHVIVPPGGEVDVNMNEADHKHLTKLLEDHDDPKPFEISGGHEAETGKKKKEKSEGDDDAHNPAQSTEPPPESATAVTPPPVTPMTEKERREKTEGKREREEPHPSAHRGR